ncbi:MAG: hypothetical protein WC827_00805 [Candidatus Paceibacterota bacterium]|jgi:hypothetical protein
MERIFIGQESGPSEVKPVTKEERAEKIMEAKTENDPFLRAKLELKDAINEHNANIKNPPKRTKSFKRND